MVIVHAVKVHTTTSAATLSLLSPLLLCKLEAIIQGNVPVGNIRVQVMESCEDIIWTILFFTNCLSSPRNKGPTWLTNYSSTQQLLQGFQNHVSEVLQPLCCTAEEMMQHTAGLER